MPTATPRPVQAACHSSPGRIPTGPRRQPCQEARPMLRVAGTAFRSRN